MYLNETIKKGKKIAESLLNCLIGCHGNHVISHYQNEFIIKEHNVFLVSGPIEPFDINIKCSKDLNVGLLTPCDTSLYNGFALFFEFSLIFMSMQMR